jgi:hypothetical protein
VIVAPRLRLLPLGPAGGATGSNLLTAALLILLTFKINARRNWARWVFVVVSGLGFLAFLFGLALAPQAFLALPPIAIGAGFIQFVLQTTAMILLLTREASRWFKGAIVHDRTARDADAG